MADSECVIISGTLSAKLCNKLFAHFHRRFVELVYVERQIAQDTKSGHYELRLFKNKDRSAAPLYTLIIDPTSMDCFVNVLHSKKHKFTFVCCSGRTSLCLSARTKFERDAWLSVLEQLRWQFQPNSDLDAHDDASSSLSATSSDDVTTDSPSQSAQSPISQDFSSSAELDDAVSHILSLTQLNGANDHSYFYNYTDSNLYRHCAVKPEQRAQRCTILGLLSANGNESADMASLETVKSPNYQAMQTSASSRSALSVLQC